MRPTKPYYENYAKQALTESLLSWMKEKPFDKISVADIAQRGQVSRRAFYLHYNTKLDILNDYYNVLIREYEANLPGKLAMYSYEETEYFFRFWYRHKDYLALLDSQDLFYILLYSFKGYINRRMSRDTSVEPDDYQFAYSSGGLWALLFKWTRDEFRETPEHLAKIATSYQEEFL
ncbi:MAG: TetR/AcrR family transcriptional regulator [Erysipelotrichales bacterium]|nr:TetR/AcrR family transcriptional regulator [Erysipelotrichales bacterium]